MIKCLHPIRIRDPNRIPDTYELPCGKCSLCLSRRRSQWSTRLNRELAVADSAYFITLTYNDENCPPYCNKEDVQKFLKRFRRAIEPHRVRYLLVCEYGGKFLRPHYHLLLFNYPFGNSRLREDLKKTWPLCEPWMFDYGDTVGTCEAASINYVCKYCLSSLDADDDNLRTFMLCSRRPAIGSNFLSSDTIRYARSRFDGLYIFDGKEIPLPRYYMDKIFTQPERELISIKRFLCKKYPPGISDERQIVRNWDAFLHDTDKKIRKSLK